jgi:hypothetical protein
MREVSGPWIDSAEESGLVGRKRLERRENYFSRGEKMRTVCDALALPTRHGMGPRVFATAFGLRPEDDEVEMFAAPFS